MTIAEAEAMFEAAGFVVTKDAHIADDDKFWRYAINKGPCEDVAAGDTVWIWGVPDVCSSKVPCVCWNSKNACPTYLGAACSNSGVNELSDFPAWSGDREERVEITSAGTVAAGSTLIAVVTWNQDGSNASRTETVYDEAGNTWTKDAESTPQGSSDAISQIWRSNLINSVSAGQYIRFAVNLGSSLLPGSEIGGRCIGVYAFGGTLSNPVEQARNKAFSSSFSLAASTGPLVVVGLAFQVQATKTIAGDGDWTPMVPYTGIDGAGGGNVGSAHIYAQYLQPAAAESWTASVTGSVDWSAIAVAYVRS